MKSFFRTTFAALVYFVIVGSLSIGAVVLLGNLGVAIFSRYAWWNTHYIIAPITVVLLHAVIGGAWTVLVAKNYFRFVAWLSEKRHCNLLTIVP